MDDLVQFLCDRLDEDQAAALAADGDAIEATPSLWDTKYLTLRGNHEDRHTTELPGALADHIARHDPARILREVDAKQKLLVLHRPVTRTDFTFSTGEPAGPLVVCHECDANTPDADWPDRPCWTLRYLALPYADHPDYRQEWRP